MIWGNMFRGGGVQYTRRFHRFFFFWPLSENTPRFDAVAAECEKRELLERFKKKKKKCFSLQLSRVLMI